MFVYKTNSDFSHTRSSVPKENLNFHKWKIYFPSSLLATEMKNRNFQLRYSVFDLNIDKEKTEISGLNECGYNLELIRMMSCPVHIRARREKAVTPAIAQTDYP